MAVAHHMRPTAILFRESDPWTGWTEKDYALLEAYETIKAETCPHCGHPIWLCRSKDPYIEWTEESYRCHATLQKETNAWRKNNPGKILTADVSRDWGRDVFMRPQHVGPAKDEPMPDRKDYYNALNEDK